MKSLQGHLVLLASAVVALCAAAAAAPASAGADHERLANHLSAIRTPELSAELLEIVPKGAKQSEYDDEYFHRSASTLVLHTTPTRGLSSQLAGSLSEASDLLLDEQQRKTHDVRVQALGERVYITVAGLADAYTGTRNTANSNAALSQLHAYLQSCDSKAAKAASAPVRRFLEHSSVATKLCPAGASARRLQGATTPAVQRVSLSLGYAFSSLEMNHDEMKRSLMQTAPGAAIHSRALSPPVFKNPLMAFARKTKPLSVSASGTRHYRMATAKAHPAVGNFSLAYDVIVDQRTVLLDDAPEVVSVTCGEHGMFVRAMHPMPQIKQGAFVQGSAEWGCVQHTSWGAEEALEFGDEPTSFVVLVKSSRMSVEDSGAITYTLDVKTVPMYAAAKQWNYMFVAHPPSEEEQAARERRRLDLSCSASPTVAVTAEEEGLINMDCQDDEIFGSWAFNYDPSSQQAVNPKLYPAAGVSSVYFSNTYAYFNTYVRLVLITYVDVDTAAAGLRKFEAVLGVSAGMNVDVVAAGPSPSTGSSAWTSLTQPDSIGSITLWAGTLPVHVSATISLVSRVPSGATSLTATAGASASSSVEYGVIYQNMLGDNNGCYCLGGCSKGASYYLWCNVNPSCPGATQHDGEDIYWKECGDFQQQTVAQGAGWNPVSKGSWTFNVDQPAVTAATTGTGPSEIEFQLGAKATVWVYGTIPLNAIPFTGVKLSLNPGSSTGSCSAGSTSGSAVVQYGLLQMDIAVGDIVLDLSDIWSELPKIYLEQGFSLTSFHVQSYASGTTLPICIDTSGSSGGGGSVGGSESSEDLGENVAGPAGSSGTEPSETTPTATTIAIGSFVGGAAFAALVAAGVVFMMRRKTNAGAGAPQPGHTAAGGSSGREVINPLPSVEAMPAPCNTAASGV